MMVKALITTAILATSTAAFAAPASYGHGPVVHETVRTTVASRNVVREPVRAMPVAQPAFRNTIRPIVREPARPVVVRNDARRYDRDDYRIVRDGRDLDRGYYRHAPIVVEPAPVVVSIPTYTSAPTAFIGGQETIGLGDATGAGIELNADGGCTFVQSALITYQDGAQATVQIGRQLDNGSPALELQTDGSPVASVTVFGSGNGVAAFMV